jgi:predicted ArsR family transcriptional regulator
MEAVNLLDLLGDPVRVSILRALAAGEPVTLDEVAARAGVHANTVRAHIGELEGRGAVVREHAQTGRAGRPQVLYRLRESWRLPSSDMGGLAELLAALALRLEPSKSELNELGRQWGRYLAGRPGQEELASLPLELERLGFDSHLEGDELRVSGCPCPLVAPGRPALVCGLMKAVVDGFAEAATGRHLVASSTHDPARRRCTVRLGERRHRGLRPRGGERSKATKGASTP